MKSGNLNFLEPSGQLQACNGTALPLPYICDSGTIPAKVKDNETCASGKHNVCAIGYEKYMEEHRIIFCRQKGGL